MLVDAFFLVQFPPFTVLWRRMTGFPAVACSLHILPSYIMHKDFNYSQAFSRNIGWLTVEEQERLRGARAAIAGLGGVGGGHLLTLARLGVGNFNISDFDYFEIHNFNRQAGAMMSTV